MPTGNFGDVYAGYLAKKWDFIDKLIVSTNENDILQRAINTESMFLRKLNSISPSMDIQVASNFERLIFDATNFNDAEVALLMSDLKKEGSFKLKNI